MNRGMIVTGVLLVGLVIAMIYQQQKGVSGLDPVQGKHGDADAHRRVYTLPVLRPPTMRGPLRDAPQEDTPQSEIPQGTIPQTGSYEGGWLEDM